MSERINAKTGTGIEDRLKGVLDGDMLDNALNFVAHLRSIGMTSDSGSRFHYKDEYTCILVFFKDKMHPSGLWVICDCPIEEYDGFPLDESLKEFARANVKICTGECGCSNWPRGGDKYIFGREFKSICSSEIQFLNPSAGELVKIKQLMDYWKLMIDEGMYKGR